MAKSPLLTFKNGSFVLHKDGEVQQLDLKAALPFRRYSDEIATRVFGRSLARSYGVPRLPPLSFLDPHQREGVAKILSRSRSYLAHAPGAGKTFQAITASYLIPGDLQTLFIVPPALTVNWKREIANLNQIIFAGAKKVGYFEEWQNWASVAIVPKMAEARGMNWKADIIICPDSMLAKDWVHNRLREKKFKLIAVDEASRFKESGSERTKALFGGKGKKRNFHGLVQRAKHTVLLDGSPMPNRPMELWAPTYAMDPEAIDCLDQRDFGFRYCGPVQNEYGAYEFAHSSNEQELHEKLTREFMHVVTEEQLSHPERRRSMVYINEEIRTLEMRSWERRNLPVISFDSMSEDASQGELATYRKDLGLRKVPFIASYVNDKLYDKNESILLFVWHREVAEKLADLLFAYKPALIIGGVDEETREKAFADFQSGKIKLIIGNIGAMGRGHNLQKADRVIFGEYSWTSESNRQCEKRASRRGNTAAFVRCEYVVMPDSLDERILQAVFTKEKRIRKVIG